MYPCRMIVTIVDIVVLVVGVLFFGTGCSQSKDTVYVESGITNLVQLTSGKTFDLDPCWSKDGGKMAFASNRSGYLEIWIMPVKGGGIQQITMNSSSADRWPVLSPDETEMVFQSSRVTGVWNIWKISLGNRGLTQLTNNPNGSFTPKWSPDGKRLAYAANDKQGDSYIWIMGINGEEPTQLGPGRDPDWSPDGHKILFSKKTATGEHHIWVMNSDGSNGVQLTSAKEKHEISPVWSKDSNKILYVVRYDSGDYFVYSGGSGVSAGWDIRSEIWMMDSQGRNQTQLTAFKGLNVLPAWSPDNKTIAFVSDRGDGWNLWTMTPLGVR